MSQYFFNTWSVPYFLSFFVSISIAILLFLKKRKDKHVQLFIIAQILFAILTLSAAIATCCRDPNIWDIWNSINTISSIFGVTVFYHFSYISLKKKKVFENKKILVIYILPLFFLIFVIINPENLVVESYDTDLGIYGKEFTGPYSFSKPVFYSALGLMLILTTINFIRMFRESEELILKQRALFFVLSTFIPFIGHIISVTFVEIFHIILHVHLGMVFLSISGAIIAYGILKHKLFDIEIIVKKTFVYLIITVIFIGIFRLIELSLSNFISSKFFGSDLTARLVGAAIIAGMFFPLRGKAIIIADKLFPDLTKTIKLDHRKKLVVYRKQLEFALIDEVINDKEEKMLRSLRTDLEISDEEHEQMVGEILENKKNYS